MATFTKRQGKWRVQIRRIGFPSITKTFIAKTDAEKWAREQERLIDRGELPTHSNDLRAVTVGDLLTRYREDITPTKRAKATEGYMIKTMLAHPLALVSLNRLSPADIAQYRDDRLKQVSPSTVLRELVLLTHMFNLAIKEWHVPLTVNPTSRITKPQANQARDRRLENDELVRLLASMKKTRNPFLKSAFLLAVHTGMRRGEMLNLTWENVDLERKTAFLPLTKNGTARTVPLSPEAIAVLKNLGVRNEGRVLPITPNALRLAWSRIKRRTGISNLHWHDLRHEAVSRFFELGLSVPEVSLISGHRDPRMLARYTHLKPEVVAAKLECARQRDQRSSQAIRQSPPT